MSELEQFLAMLEKAGVEHERHSGTYVDVRGSRFVFHVDGSLKEVWGVADDCY